MPQCFTLTKKTEPGKLAILQEVDKAICEHFGAECHETRWYHGWYDYIGFSVAMGKTLSQVAEACLEHETDPKEDESSQAFWKHMREIALWLDAEYTTDAWAEIGKR